MDMFVSCHQDIFITKLVLNVHMLSQEYQYGGVRDRQQCCADKWVVPNKHIYVVLHISLSNTSFHVLSNRS